MAEAFWRYAEARQPVVASVPGKRSRSDYDMVAGQELSGYYPREDERSGHRLVRDTEAIGASYERYLRSGQVPSYGGGEPGRPLAAGMSSHPVDGSRMVGVGSLDAGMAAKARSVGFGSGRADILSPQMLQIRYMWRAYLQIAQEEK
ncbi:hypothetical protein Syun_019845 [Stephania yunnanensis]|uniref:Uncharacterized protein n=1 Tax=Stephania yunnanensis TaxID=152371 RepID=A0AAP0NX18_9MAGN